MLTANRIETFLDVMKQQAPEDWGWQCVNEQFWSVTFRKSYPPFAFLVEYNEDILYVQYVFRDLLVHSRCWLAIYRTLLRLNEELTLVKFGITAYNNVVLMGELPSDQVSLDTLQNLLLLMVHYLEDLYWEIGIVAEADDLAPFLIADEVRLSFLEGSAKVPVKKLHTEKMT